MNTPQSAQNSFAREFSEEAKKRGNFKSLAGMVGMPDKDDWENIINIISLYRKESIKRYGYDILIDCITKAKKDYQQFGGKYESKAKGFNLVNKDSNMRYHFEFPESFVSIIEVAYPLMFRDKAHYHWFCKNFATLRISDRF